MKNPRQRTSVQVGGIAVAMALTLAGCSSARPEAQTSATPAPTVSDAAAAGATAEETPSEDSVPVDAEPLPEPGVENDALALAAATVTAFCRPTLDYDTWISELFPFLTQQAGVAYATVDPANIPCTTLAGNARVRDGDGIFTIRVLVPTDAGEYSVYVHRVDETGPWSVEQITPLVSE